MAKFKKSDGTILDTNKYINLAGQEAIDWAGSQELFSGATLVPDINDGLSAPAPIVPAPITPTPSNDLYIGGTNWSTLQNQYNPAQLEYATELKDGKRYWRTDRHIEDYKASATIIKPEAEEEVKITADSFKEEADLALPGAIDGDSGADIPASAAQTVKTLEDYIKENTPPETEASQKEELLETKMQELMGETANMGADQLAEETNRNIPQLRADFADLNAEILQITAEYDALKQVTGDKPITMASIIGQQTKAEREKLSKIGILQARALGLQGQINTAQAAADRAIDLKYSTIETTLKIYQAQLDMIGDEVDDEEKVFWEARQQMLNDQTNLLNERKATEKSIHAIAFTALGNGADNALVAQIQNASTEIEAAQIAGQTLTSGGWEYVGTYEERDRLIDLGYEKMETGGRTYVRPPDPAISSYVQQIKAGKMKLINVPAELRSQTAIALGDTSYSGDYTPQQQQPQQDGGGWTEQKARLLFSDYLEGGYNLSEAKERVEELTNQKIRFGHNEARQFVADNPGASTNELKSILLEFTKGVLSVSEVNALLSGRAKITTEELGFEDF